MIDDIVMLGASCPAYTIGTVLGQTINFVGEQKKIGKISTNLTLVLEESYSYFVENDGYVSFQASNFQSCRNDYVFQPVIAPSFVSCGTPIQNSFQIQNYTNEIEIISSAPYLKYNIYFSTSGLYYLWAYGYSDSLLWTLNDDTTNLRKINLECTSIETQAVAGYKLYVARDNGFSDMVSGYPVTLDNVLCYTVTGLVPNTTYYYRVIKYNDEGNSNYSNIIEITTLEQIIPTWTNFGSFYIEEGGLYTFTVYSPSDNTSILDQWVFTTSNNFDSVAAYVSPPELSKGPFNTAIRARSLYNEEVDSLDLPQASPAHSSTAWLSSNDIKASGKFNYEIRDSEGEVGITFNDGLSIEYWQIGGNSKFFASWDYREVT